MLKENPQLTISLKEADIMLMDGLFLLLMVKIITQKKYGIKQIIN